MNSLDNRFYGVYLGICVDNNDPDQKNKIKLQVPQVLGEAVSEWALPCLPVIGNSNHPDHKKHLASEVAAILANHGPTTFTTASGGGFDPHTHTVSVNFTHSGKTPNTTYYLDHAHETDPDEANLWNDNLEITTEFPEHTPHRLVPDIEQKVWVMFIAGDPNFPVWIGVL